MDALEAAISCPAAIYRWKPNDTENPYFGYLALAASVIVTGDSIAMLSDACATRKPVHIFDLGGMQSSAKVEPFTAALRSGWNPREPGHIKAAFYGLLMRFGPRRLSRDLRCVFDELIEAGCAVWLGQDFPLRETPPLGDLSHTVTRVKALLDDDNNTLSSGTPQDAGRER
jgi:hypothetical protein